MMAFTDWKALRKIDAHIHMLPDAVHAANPDSEDEWGCADIHKYEKIMAANNIERAVIMPFNDPWLMSMEFTVDAVHRNLAEFKRMYPGKIYAFADVDTRNSPEESVDAICRAIDDYGLDGIKIHPTNTDMPLDSDYNDAIFEFASERNMPVAIHSYPNTDDDVCAATRVVSIAERFPGLRLIVSHMGALQWEALLPLGCHVDMSAILPDYVRSYGIPKTNEILRAFGVDRLLFATDYPLSRLLKPDEIYASYYNILNRMDFTEEEAIRIAYTNAEELLGS